MSSTSNRSTTTEGLRETTVLRVLSELGEIIFPEWKPAFFAPERIIIATGGEGSGKSYQGGLYAVCQSFYDASVYGGPGLYWVVGADFEDARKEFDYILEFEERLGNVAEVTAPLHRDQQCVLRTNTNQTFITVSAYDATKLGRDEPDGIIGAEVSRWEQEAFLRCEGRLARKFPRAWGFFSGSFESSLGWLPAIWNLGQGPTGARGIRSFSIPAWANRTRYPGGREDPAIKALEEANSPERFMERYGGRPAPPRGIIFDAFNTLLHVDPYAEVDTRLPVYLAVDPGTKVYAVLFVQFTKEGEIVVLDEIYAQRWTHRQVIEAVQAHPFWPLVQGGAIDIAAKQSHMGMPVPLEEWYRDTGMSLVTNKLPLDDSIERVRAALTINPTSGRPRLRVHPFCRGLISEMGGGPSPVDGGGPWLRVPHRDGYGQPESRNNHSCMALAYLLAGPFGFTVLPNYYPQSRQSEPVSYLTAPRERRAERWA